jgi:phosphate transport system substrate-binding protein
MKRLLHATAAFLLGLLGVAPSAQAADLTISGATTVQKRIMEPSLAALEAATGIKLLVRGINSGRGLEELQAGKVPVSMSAEPLQTLLDGAKLPNDGTYQGHLLMQDLIVVIVHPSNTVPQLTWEQLADIHAGKVTNWKEVGGPDQAIVVVTDIPTAATRHVFQKMVMKDAPFVPGAREVQSTREQVELVGKFKGGIGVVSEAFVKMNPGKVKVVKSKEISRPLLLVTKGKPQPDVQKVIDFLQTPRARALFQ